MSLVHRTDPIVVHRSQLGDVHQLSCPECAFPFRFDSPSEIEVDSTGTPLVDWQISLVMIRAVCSRGHRFGLILEQDGDGPRDGVQMYAVSLNADGNVAPRRSLQELFAKRPDAERSRVVSLDE